MNIEYKILKILKFSYDLGKNKMQIQNIDHLLVRKGEKEYIGSVLTIKLKEMISNEIILKNETFYSITKKGLEYLEQHSED